VIYLASVLIVVGVSLFVAAPLFDTVRRGRNRRVDSERGRLEHERALAVQALRELEFDREMRKLGEQDWAELKQQLEGRALRAMAALERLDKETAARTPSAGRRRVIRIAETAQGAAPAIKFCPTCGKPVTGKVNFCAQCGGALSVRDKSMTR
jgi:hypothetical protein